MGEAKNYHGLARARFRGLIKVEIQFLMTAAALNLKKMVRTLDRKVMKNTLSMKASEIIQIIEDIFTNFGERLAIHML